MFELVPVLSYTKMITNGVECLFSVSGKLLRAKRTRLTSGNVWVVLLLRSRFKDLGYTKNI